MAYHCLHCDHFVEESSLLHIGGETLHTYPATRGLKRIDVRCGPVVQAELPQLPLEPTPKPVQGVLL